MRKVDPDICLGCPAWNSLGHCIAIGALLRTYAVKPENKEGVELDDRPADCLREDRFKRSGSCWKPRIPKPRNENAKACELYDFVYATCGECSWWHPDDD